MGEMLPRACCYPDKDLWSLAKNDWLANEGAAMQVYAYTWSLPHTAILRIFTRCECILPNLFVGVLTWESVSGALSCGPSADQIVLYLRLYLEQVFRMFAQKARSLGVWL